jgi:hypothetical protein
MNRVFINRAFSLTCGRLIMRQPKQKRGFIRKATITLAAIAAGSLPMLTPQWMTSVAAYGNGKGIYNIGTERLSFSEIVIPIVDAITRKENGNTNVFEVSLDKQQGNWVFEMDPSTFKWVKKSASDPNPVKYDSTNRDINVPCVQAVFDLPTGSMEFWYNDAILEQVYEGAPIFELVEMQKNGRACP